MDEIERLKQKFPKNLTNLQKEVKFTDLVICSIKTAPGKIVVKRGAIVPQSMEEDAKKYLGSLLERRIIQNSAPQWRNTIRYLRKPDDPVSVISNLSSLNDIVEQDSYRLSTMRKLSRRQEALIGSLFWT